MCEDVDFGPYRWRNGDLTKASMLYEGAFEEWWSHIQAVRRIQENHSFAIDFEPGGLGFECLDHTKSAAELFRSVSPNLLRRLPTSELQSIETLLPALKVASRPFRLMDLPVDIRLLIYGYIPLYLNFRVYKNKWGPGSLHPLLACSKQVRQEALPLASIVVSIEASLNVFGSNSPNSTNQGNTGFRDFAKQLSVWSLRDGENFVRNISRLHLNFMEYCDTCGTPCSAGEFAMFDIGFALNPSRGLFVEYYGGWHLNDFMRKEIERELTELELERKASGAPHGGVLIMLVAERLPKWKFLKHSARE